MLQKIQKKKTVWRIAENLIIGSSIAGLLAQPAAASHETLNCAPPESLSPLLQFLHTVTELAFLAGVGLGVLGFSTAGLLFMIPGETYNRRGKMLAKNCLIGVIILLSANMIVSFLVNELGGVICT